MNIKQNFESYFDSNFEITVDYLDNKLINLTSEQFDIFTCMSKFKPETILDMSYFEIEFQEFIYIKKFKTVKSFEFHFNLFNKTRDEVVQLYNEQFIERKDYFDIFEYFVGDFELFSTMKHMHMIKLYKLNEENFFDCQIYLELLLINCAVNPFTVKGRIINNFDSEYLLGYLLKPVKSNNYHIIKSVAGIYSYAFEECYLFKNKCFYEIFFKILQAYKNPNRIYMAAINFYHKKFSVFGNRPYAYGVLNNFNLEFLNSNHVLFQKDNNFALKIDAEIKPIEQNYITLYNLWSIKNKNYYSILKLKESIAASYHEKNYFKLSKDQDNPENRFKLLDVLNQLENYYKTKFISNNILNIYFNNQKIYFI